MPPLRPITSLSCSARLRLLPVRLCGADCHSRVTSPPATMQALANKTNGRVKAFASANRAAPRVRAVQCRAQQQQSSNVQQVAAAVLAAVAVCTPAAHAATEVIQSGVDMSLAVGSGAAVAGLGALLVAADPQKRWVAAVRHSWTCMVLVSSARSNAKWPCKLVACCNSAQQEIDRLRTGVLLPCMPYHLASTHVSLHVSYIRHSCNCLA
jgi:hypothetical protein